jgi:hypothetical protein
MDTRLPHEYEYDLIPIRYVYGYKFVLLEMDIGK